MIPEIRSCLPAYLASAVSGGWVHIDVTLDQFVAAFAVGFSCHLFILLRCLAISKNYVRRRVFGGALAVE